VSRVHDGDDPIEPEAFPHVFVHEERLCHRPGVRETGGLDEDVIELVPSPHEVAENADEIAANGAADAAVVHLEHLLVGIDHEFVVDADFAEFILDDGDAFAVLSGEQMVEQGGLARTEEAGEDGDGDGLGVVHGIFGTRGIAAGGDQRRSDQ
jgi:hypothetical protein